MDMGDGDAMKCNMNVSGGESLNDVITCLIDLIDAVHVGYYQPLHRL